MRTFVYICTRTFVYIYAYLYIFARVYTYMCYFYSYTCFISEFLYHEWYASKITIFMLLGGLLRRMPHLHRSLYAKEPCIVWLFCRKRPATSGILYIFAALYGDLMRFQSVVCCTLKKHVPRVVAECVYICEIPRSFQIIRSKNTSVENKICIVGENTRWVMVVGQDSMWHHMYEWVSAYIYEWAIWMSEYWYEWVMYRWHHRYHEGNIWGGFG